MNYKILIIFIATGCLSMTLGLARIKPITPKHFVKPVHVVKKAQPTVNIVSSNVILVWPKMNHAIYISNKDIEILTILARTNRKKFDELTRPTYKITGEEFSSMVNNQEIAIASSLK